MNDATPAGAQQPSDSQPANHLITEVLVVGAIPTGRMLANWLARVGVGVGVIAIDGTAGPTNESRALVVQAQSMEIDYQLGIAEQVLAHCAGALERPRIRHARVRVHPHRGHRRGHDRLGAQLGVPVHSFPAPSTPRLRAGMFYLVRPDGFVAAQATASEAAGVFRAALPERDLVAALS